MDIVHKGDKVIVEYEGKLFLDLKKL